jgi:hypothetical protein
MNKIEEIKSDIKRYENRMEEWEHNARKCKFALIEAEKAVLFYQQVLLENEHKLKELENEKDNNNSDIK